MRFREDRNIVLTVAGYGFLGLLAGLLSLVILPNYLIENSNYRLANLIVTPVIIGICMAILGGLLRRRDKEFMALDSFSNGYIFALIMSLTRWLWAG